MTMKISTQADFFADATATFDGDLMVLNEDAHVVRLDPADLTSPIWTLDATAVVPDVTTQMASEPIQAVADVVFVGEAVHRLADGSDAGWSAEDGDYQVVEGELVRLHSDGNGAHAYGVNSADGTESWQAHADLFVASDAQLVGLSRDGAVGVAVSPTSGNTTALTFTGDFPAAAPAISMSRCDVQPLGDTAYIDIAADGGPRIAASEPGFHPFASSGGYVYFTDFLTAIRGVQRGTGETAWDAPMELNDMAGSSVQTAGGHFVSIRNDLQPTTVTGLE
jgi:hypothetical protein